MNCNNCGSPLEEGVVFCANCGAKVEQVQDTPLEVTPLETTPDAPMYDATPADTTPDAPMYDTTPASPVYDANPSEPTYNAAPNTTYTAPQGTTPVNDVNVNSTPYLIWSIANMVLCCLPLGIVGLIMTLKAGKATSQYEAEEALKKAKMWNIIGSATGVLVVIIYVIVMVLSLSTFGY